MDDQSIHKNLSGNTNEAKIHTTREERKKNWKEINKEFWFFFHHFKLLPGHRRCEYICIVTIYDEYCLYLCVLSCASASGTGTSIEYWVWKYHQTTIFYQTSSIFIVPFISRDFRFHVPCTIFDSLSIQFVAQTIV